MNRSRASLMALALLATPVTEALAESPDEDMETVLVTGEQPGPGLWKVSRNGHVMWVLGSIGEIPKAIQWRTKEVEARIAESQEVLYPGWADVKVDIGAFEFLTLVPAALKAAKNPDGATLKDVMPPETYERWLRLKLKYLGDDDDIEKYRPTIAEEKLRDTVVRDAGKKNPPFISIDSVVDRFAKKHGVKIRRLPMVVRKIEVEKPRAILKAARKFDFSEGECVGRNLQRLEEAIDRGQFVFNAARYNDWAKGDLQKLREVPDGFPVPEDCIMATQNELPGEVGRGFDIIKKQEELAALANQEAERNWLDAAEAALAKNPSTFAVLPMGIVLCPSCHLGKLQARGYLVEAPL